MFAKNVIHVYICMCIYVYIYMNISTHICTNIYHGKMRWEGHWPKASLLKSDFLIMGREHSRAHLWVCVLLQIAGVSSGIFCKCRRFQNTCFHVPGRKRRYKEKEGGVRRPWFWPWLLGMLCTCGEESHVSVHYRALLTDQMWGDQRPKATSLNAHRSQS